jgi:hypothetical protein
MSTETGHSNGPDKQNEATTSSPTMALCAAYALA